MNHSLPTQHPCPLSQIGCSRCPICRRSVKHLCDPQTGRPIVEVSPKTQQSHDDEFGACEVCGREDMEDDDLALICDGCNRVYHTFCIGLHAVPTDDFWLCATCMAEIFHNAAPPAESESAEVSSVPDEKTAAPTEGDNVNGEDGSRPEPQSKPRLLPRDHWRCGSYHCPSCEWVCGTPRGWRRHIKSCMDGANEIVFVCGSCGRHIGRLDNFRRHQRICRGPVQG